MNSYAAEFLGRIKAAADKLKDLSGLPAWLVKNTRSPKDRSEPWSFKDHEYQLDILRCDKQEVCTRKCSQVGLSELSVRMMLAMLSIFPGNTAIYTLPVAKFASKFAKSRIDPVVDGSPTLRDQVSNDIDNSELKQIGTSFLYISGTWGQVSAISVPADMLFRDEVDFSNQTVLSTFMSRLGHADNGGYVRDFSTPTVDGFGISKGFENSTQARYLARCDHCSQWVAPDFFNHTIVPGYDDHLLEFTKEDLADPRYRVKDAYLICPSCRMELTVANLADPEKRQWVHSYPDRDRGGFQVMPFDVITVNPVSKTLLSIDGYERKADWVNFKIGIPYEDAESSFMQAAVLAGEVLRHIAPRLGAATGCVAGLDVGKISWLTIGREEGDKLHVFHVEQIKQDGNDHLTTRVLECLLFYGVVRLVVDATPDFSTALKLISKAYVNQVFACYYVRKPSTPLANYDVKEEEQVVNAGRTVTIDSLAKRVNTGKMLFLQHPEMRIVKEHLGALKRVRSVSGQGDEVASWVGTGPDHYAHSLNYLNIAAALANYTGLHAVIPTLPMAGRVRIGSISEPEISLLR